MSDTGNDNMTVSGAIQLAIALYREGRFKEALGLCGDILATVPDQTDILQLASGLASGLGEHRRAAEYLITLLKLDPGNAPAHNDLGGALGAMGEWEEAAAAHRRAIMLDPKYAEAYNNLGAALAALTLFEPAQAAYLKAIELAPGFAKAHNNLGILLFTRGEFQSSLDFCTRAIEIEPDYAKAHGARGNALHGLGRVDEAVSAYGRAIKIDPNLAEAHNSLGNAMKLRGDYEKALASYRRAIEIAPNYASAHYNLGNAQHDLGDFEESLASLERCRKLDNSPGVAVRLALLSPIIAASTEQIKTVRGNVEAALDDLTDQGLRIADPCVETRFTNFLFAYHGLDDRPLQEKIATFYLRACPDLGWTAPHCKQPKSQSKGGKVRLGIVSAHFTGHTVAKLFEGVLKNLSSDRLELVLFDASGKGNGVAETYAHHVHKVVALTTNSLAGARGQIAAEEPDILFYPDIGMNSLTFFLAFSRLAPVQCCSWGHGITTGIPNMDVFLSCAAMEEPDGQKYYSEKLVTLNHFPMNYTRPSLPGPAPGRAALGLPEDGTLYVCPQSLFKFHPDFDATLGDLLRRDPEGKLILITDAFEGRWRDRLAARFGRAFPDQASRVVFIDRLSGEDFLHLLSVADALLDVPQYSGGNTTLEAFSLGTPVITWPGPILKERVTAAFYDYIGVTDLIADGSQAYVDIAFRLANDRTWREEMKAKILDHCKKLYGDTGAVGELESFFIEAVGAAR